MVLSSKFSTLSFELFIRTKFLKVFIILFLKFLINFKEELSTSSEKLFNLS